MVRQKGKHDLSAQQLFYQYICPACGEDEYHQDKYPRIEWEEIPDA